jgi:hypothetical protein
MGHGRAEAKSPRGPLLLQGGCQPVIEFFGN